MSIDTSKDSIVIVLPLKLPTWNALLAMNPWERKKVRDFLKGIVSTAIREAGGSVIVTGVRLNIRLTELQKAAYGQMTATNASRKYRSRKKLERKIKQS